MKRNIDFVFNFFKGKTYGIKKALFFYLRKEEGLCLRTYMEVLTNLILEPSGGHYRLWEKPILP